MRGTIWKFTEPPEGDRRWSNRSKLTFEIEEDGVGAHDLLLAPRGEAGIPHFYSDRRVYRGDLGNLAEALVPYWIGPNSIRVAINMSLNVPVNPATVTLSARSPRSRAGNFIRLCATFGGFVGRTACSACAPNGGSFKPVHYDID